MSPLFNYPYFASVICVIVRVHFTSCRPPHHRAYARSPTQSAPIRHFSPPLLDEMPHPIPDIPGEHVREPDAYMVEHFYTLCGLGDKRNPPFPGAQPVSFSRDSLRMLETMDFWVCEKSDGVRLLVFIIKNPYSGQQETWLVSRTPAQRCKAVQC